MALYTVTATDVAVIESVEEDTQPAAETIAAGQYVRYDSNGRFALGNGTTAAEVGYKGFIAVNGARAGFPVRGINKGKVAIGEAFAGATIGSQVFLSDTDGTLADAAGTVSKVVGVIAPAWAQNSVDRILSIGM